MSDGTLHILEMLIGVVVILTCVAAVPFAMRVTGLLAKIETKLDAMAWQATAINELQRDLNAVKVEMAAGQQQGQRRNAR
jgi:hypothetical protein